MEDEGMGVLEAFAYAAPRHEKLLEGGFGSPRRSTIRLDGTGLQSTVPTLFSADTRTTLHRPYLGRKGIKFEVGPTSPTSKPGRGRGPAGPWVEGAHRNDFHGRVKPFSVETDPEELALTGVQLGNKIRLGARDKTPVMGPKGLGAFCDGTKRMPPSRSAKVIVQFDPPRAAPQLPPRAATAGGGPRVRIRDQITERAQTPLEPGAKREYDPHPHAEALPAAAPPSARPRTSGEAKGMMGAAAAASPLRPGTGGGGGAGTARRPRTVEGGGPRSASALGLVTAAGGEGGGGVVGLLGPVMNAGETKVPEGMGFVRNNPEERFGACKQMHPQGLLAEERHVRPLFSLSGGVREVQFEEEGPHEDLTNVEFRVAQYAKWKKDRAAISMRYKAGSGDVVTWQAPRNLGTPPRAKARRAVHSLANTKHAEMVARAGGGANRPHTPAAPAPRVATPAWMTNPKEMANIGRFNNTIDYSQSKLIARSELRAQEMEARQQVIQCENQAEVWGDRARRERDKGAAEAAYHSEQKVIDIRNQQRLAREALAQAEAELAALRAADGESSRPGTGGGVLPAGMLETDLRRVMRASTRLELIFILRSVGVGNTLYPDTKLHELTHGELSNTVAASPMARGKFLEMMRRTPVRTVKHAGAGWLVAVDRGGRARPEKPAAEAPEKPATPAAEVTFDTARSYDSYGGVNVTNYWRTGRRPHHEHSVHDLQRDIFIAPKDKKVITGRKEAQFARPHTAADRPDGPNKPTSPQGAVPGAVADEDHVEG